jgi:hypothetical protein
MGITNARGGSARCDYAVLGVFMTGLELMLAIVIATVAAICISYGIWLSRAHT